MKKSILQEYNNSEESSNDEIDEPLHLHKDPYKLRRSPNLHQELPINKNRKELELSTLSSIHCDISPSTSLAFKDLGDKTSIASKKLTLIDELTKTASKVAISLDLPQTDESFKSESNRKHRIYRGNKGADDKNDKNRDVTSPLKSHDTGRGDKKEASETLVSNDNPKSSKKSSHPRHRSRSRSHEKKIKKESNSRHKEGSHSRHRSDDKDDNKDGRKGSHHRTSSKHASGKRDSHKKRSKEGHRSDDRKRNRHRHHSSSSDGSTKPRERSHKSSTSALGKSKKASDPNKSSTVRATKPTIPTKSPLEVIEAQKEAAIRKAKEIVAEKAPHVTTGIVLPSYYNPATVDPVRYAERARKRKLLWRGTSSQLNDDPDPDTTKGGDPSADTKDGGPQPILRPTEGAISTKVCDTGTSNGKASTTNTFEGLNATEIYWQNTAFAQNEQTEKFRKLMGIKKMEDKNPALKSLGKLSQSPAGSDASTPTLTEEEKRKRQELFEKLNRQYEIARMSTHTMRGVGLGYASSTMYQQPE